MALADDLNMGRAYVASDCKSVIIEIADGSKGRHGAIIAEFNDRASRFQECSFVFESRASNFESHNLAKHMISSGVGRHLWLGTPDYVTILVHIISHQ